MKHEYYMNTTLFLNKYHSLLKKIVDSNADNNKDFYDIVHIVFYNCMAEYYNFITEYSDDREGEQYIRAIHRLINNFKLPIKEFKVPERALHIFYEE